MADDRSQGGKPSWRGKAESDRQERPARTEKSSYKWTNRGQTSGAGGRPTGSRSVRLVASFVAFAACLGVVVWLIWMFLPPRPTGLVLLGADYATNLAVPHNALGYQGVIGIEQLARAPRPWALFKPAELKVIRNPSGQMTLERTEDWDALIASLEKGFGAPTLVLVLALHGGSDADGAYLMPNQMKRPEDRLDMKKVIASMKQLPAETAKVLVVEGAQVASDWRLGILHNDFARRLKDLEPEIRAVPNLWVLSGCDEDQRCWASEGLGRTIFHYYLTEALRGGRAAGADGRLSLDELYRYVREHVSRWAWAARGAVQEPVLLPAGGGAAAGAGAAASEPARLDPATVFLATVETKAPAEAPAPPARDALTSAWLGYRQLDALVPHPSVYSPMRWRAYGAALVRFEQLLLAGASESAQRVREQLSQLEEAMRKDRVLSGVSASIGVNLVMEALNGVAKDPPEPSDEFVKIALAADYPGAEKIWDGLRTREPTGDDGRGSIRPLRNRLAEKLLGRAQDNPVKELARAAERIPLAGLSGELPAEAHFLRMLQSPPLAGRPESFWRRAAQALRVRVLAERAAMGVSPQADGYPYCEQVHAVTRPIVEKADENRRTGEDRLFADDERTWELAQKDLANAEADYKRALDQAIAIRSALATRDRALTALPDYARWLVHRHPDDLAGRVEALWAKAHQLSEMLEQPGERKGPATIEQTAQDLDAGLDQLVAQFVQERGSTAKVRLREDWEVDTAAGAVLFPDDENLTVRKGIWDRLDDIRLHDQELARSPVSTPDGAERPDPDRIAEATRRLVAIQGTLAMAALGETWFGDAAFKDLDQGDYGKTRKRLGALPNQAADVDPWWKAAARDGDRIGLRFRALRGKVEALADEGRGIASFAAFQSRLAQADGLARLVERGEDPAATSTVEPSSRYRQARVHDLLVWMAVRAWRDHWYSEKPTAPPYYQKIVARLFNDAQGLFPELKEADQKRREELSVPGRLALNGPDRLVVTSEREASVALGVIDETGANTVPAGIPVVRPTVKGRVSLLDSKPAYRAAIRGTDAAVAVHLKNETFVDAESRAAGFDALLSNPASRSASLDVEGFFRGQVFSRQTKVDLQVVPDAVAIGPAPTDLASVAIRASDDIIRRFGRGTGSIAIVLDCSGSMLEPIAGGTKWAAAKKALSLVLKDSVPPGTNLSIWSFSQFPPGDIQLDETGHIPRGVYTQEQLQPIRDLEKKPQDTIKCQRTMAPWDPAQADNVNAMLNKLEPFFGTPLVDAMWKAASTDLDKAEIRGFKNLIVLTDGEDTEFATNSALNPGGKLSIPTFLKQKFPRGIRITVVYFHAGKQASKKELENAAHEFEEPLRLLEPPGRFVKAMELGELTTHLRAGLDQKLVCQVVRSDRIAAGEPLEVTRPEGDLLRWSSAGLAPGYYWLRVLADRPYEQKVNLQSGDRLIVELVDDEKDGIAFRRVLYGDDPRFRDGEKANAGSWRLTVLGNQMTRRTEDQPPGLALMAALESTVKTEDTLEQLRPGWVDIQLSPEGLKDSSPVLAPRWRERMTYPAPVWQLDVPRWPTDLADPGKLDRPILTAWWLAKPDAASAVAFDFEPARVTFPYDVPLDDGRIVRVEEFAWEDHLVEVQPGQLPQSRHCLVIRLSYPVGSPYFIDPDSLKDVETKGYEHRYYHRAGKYAGLFWEVNESQFKILRKSKFRVISLARLRELAEKRGQKVRITLESPRDVVKLPEPPQAIQQ